MNMDLEHLPGKFISVASGLKVLFTNKTKYDDKKNC